VTHSLQHRRSIPGPKDPFQVYPAVSRVRRWSNLPPAIDPVESCEPENRYLHHSGLSLRAWLRGGRPSVAYSDDIVVTEGLNAEFLGGPPRLFVEAGREQLIVLLEHGLMFDSRVLDVGCGALRGGRWVIPLLEPGHYCGIEPAEAMLARGLRDFVPAGIIEIKRPRFDNNDRFDFSVFGVHFTHVMARSIWTHASKPQIEVMLDGFAEWATEDGVFLASFFPSGDSLQGEDYSGDEWVGRSHLSEEKGTVGHALSWIERACENRRLVATRLDREPLREESQVWCAVRRA